MSIWLWLFFSWVSFEYINIIWEIRKNRLYYAPLSFVVNFLYKQLYGKRRWTNVSLDQIGIFAHLTICNLILALSVTLWSNNLLPIVGGVGFLLTGIVLQLIENLTWSKNGLTPFFISLSNQISLINGTGEVESGEKDRLKQKIKSFIPAEVLPSLVARILVVVIIISLAFASIYRQVLLIDQAAFHDADKNPISYSDYPSLIAYSLETTTSGSSDMKAATGFARIIYAFQKASNIFIFSLLIGNIVLISQEYINQRKKDLLNELGDEENKDETNN